MSTRDGEEVYKELVLECRDDFVGLWSVIRQVRRTLSDDAIIHEATMALIRRLMMGEEVIAGEFESNEFQVWEMPVEDVVNRIRREWAELGREPTLGDIVWFTARGRLA